MARRARIPRSLRRAARGELVIRVGRTRADAILAEADRSFPAVAADIPKTGAGARNLLRTGAYSIALQRTLVGHGFSTEAATALVSDAVFISIRPAHEFLDRIGRLFHRDQRRRGRWKYAILRRFYYTAPDWEMEEVPVPGGWGVDITRCAVAEFFARQDMSELCQRAICEQDARVAAHFGLEFTRSGTLATGADRCDFRYYLPQGGARVA